MYEDIDYQASRLINAGIERRELYQFLYDFVNQHYSQFFGHCVRYIDEKYG